MIRREAGKIIQEIPMDIKSKDQKVEGPGEKGHKKINGVEEGLGELEANSSRGQILLKVLIYYKGKYLSIGCS